MTKKDYQAIARAIHATHEDVRTARIFGEEIANRPEPAVAMLRASARAAIKAATTHVADVLAADSPRFDRARFIEACETGNMGKPRRSANDVLSRL